MTNNKIKIGVSILDCDFLNLKTEILKVKSARADFIHLDIMDGNFVPEITFGQSIIKKIKKETDLFMDTHLMIANTEESLQSYVGTGSDMIIIHNETTKHVDRALGFIKSSGLKAGIALNPSTPISFIENIIEKIDFLLLMSVNPGYGGQKFIESIYLKAAKARSILRDYNNATGKNLFFDIGVDGGVNLDNAKKIISAGVNVLIVGSAFFRSEDPKDFLNRLRQESINFI